MSSFPQSAPRKYMVSVGQGVFMNPLHVQAITVSPLPDGNTEVVFHLDNPDAKQKLLYANKDAAIAIVAKFADMSPFP